MANADLVMGFSFEKGLRNVVEQRRKTMGEVYIGKGNKAGDPSLMMEHI